MSHVQSVTGLLFTFGLPAQQNIYKNNFLSVEELMKVALGTNIKSTATCKCTIQLVEYPWY